MGRVAMMFGKVMLAAAVSIAVLAGASGARADSNVLFIFDASGSMKKKLESGETRVAVAKRAMSEALGGMPADVRLGLLMYGHRKAKDCTDIELVSPIGADDAATIAGRIEAAPAKGETPIAEALKQAVRSFAALKGQSNRIVLVTDGIEECGGDPCAAARAVSDAGLDLKVDIIGFTLTEKQRQTVQCVADATGGQYYDAQDVTGLTAALQEVQQQVVQAEPPPPPPAPAQPARFNLLSPKNGGAILAAPNDVWLATNDDSEHSVTWMRTDQEGVYGFQDDRPATFDSFAVYIGGTENGNPQEVELLAGDDGPTGQFRSIGICKFQNVKLIKTPYQECKFAAVTARYLKVRLGPNFGGDGYVYATEFQLFGELGAGGAPAAATTAAMPASRINLLSPRNGGAILAAPNDVWLSTADDAEHAVTWMRTDQEGVYGFQDERPATFDSFGLFIGATESGNAQTVELFAGDEGPLGSFRPITSCSFQNVKLTKMPYQECRFAPVTARYLKVRLGPNFGGDGYVYATEFQLMGELGEGGAAQSAAAAAAVPSSSLNLLSPRNGGAILAAPSDVWLATADDAEHAVTWMRTDQEGVYGFQDERPATFDTFAVLIGSTEAGNPQAIDILAGDESPTGQFRPVATCTFQNVKLTKTPYQPCSFAPVTARYVKVRLGPNFGGDGYVYATEFQLFGQLGEAAAATPAAATATAAPAAAVNLLSARNGGGILAAPSDVWLATVDDAEHAVTWMRSQEEGVYGFQGEQPATFDTFAVLIQSTDAGNPQTIELLAGDEGPGGAFEPVATCTFQNVKLTKSPYQPCTFPPVTARYLKVRLGPNFGGDGYVYATEFQLMGQMAQ
jgi:Mg-chelatase subunit ChlD